MLTVKKEGKWSDGQAEGKMLTVKREGWWSDGRAEDADGHARRRVVRWAG